MRNVSRSYILTDAPAILQNPSTIADCTTIAKSGTASGIKRAIYSDPYEAGEDEGIQSRVIDKLNETYFGKCAYCERFYKLDVEHFRPKGEIRDENNKLISPSGYYWLGYEWSNLLPACISCNRDGGKNSKFPYLVGGTLVKDPVFDQAGILDRNHCLTNHNFLIGERPVLLNPEIDLNIESYFSFEIDKEKQGIRIVGIDADGRGKITANVCKLNRQELRRDRLQNVIMELINSIHNSIRNLQMTSDNNAFVKQLELYFDKLKSDCREPKLSHTLLRKYIVSSTQKFDQIVVPFVIPNFQIILSHAFKNYLSNRSIASTSLLTS